MRFLSLLFVIYCSLIVNAHANRFLAQNMQIDAPSYLIRLNYEYMSILYNCKMRGFEHYYYQTHKDTGNVKRKSTFFQEKQLPKRCRQFSTKGYYNPKIKHPRFDRGHGAPANHFDFNKRASDQTNTMANVVPQAMALNRSGLWRYTDKIVECLRDSETLMVYGGNIWGNDSSNDYFLNTHGVVTPDFIYKIIVKSDGSYNAWIMPNNSAPREENGEKYLVSVKDIENATKASFPIKRKSHKPTKMFSWPGRCNFS